MIQKELVTAFSATTVDGDQDQSLERIEATRTFVSEATSQDALDLVRVAAGLKSEAKRLKAYLRLAMPKNSRKRQLMEKALGR